MRTTADFHSHWMNSLGFTLHFKCAHENPSENFQWKFNVVRNTTQHKQKEFLAITRTRKHRIDFTEKIFSNSLGCCSHGTGCHSTLPRLITHKSDEGWKTFHEFNEESSNIFQLFSLCRVASHVAATTDPSTIQLQQDPLLSGRTLSLLSLWTFASLTFWGFTSEAFYFIHYSRPVGHSSRWWTLTDWCY